MKYRIVVRDSIDFPYRIEYSEKDSWFGYWFNTWVEIDIARSIDSADKIIKKHHDNKSILKLTPGVVIKEISEEDFLVGKLQGKY